MIKKLYKFTPKELSLQYDDKFIASNPIAKFALEQELRIKTANVCITYNLLTPQAVKEALKCGGILTKKLPGVGASTLQELEYFSERK